MADSSVASVYRAGGDVFPGFKATDSTFSF